MSKNQKLNDLYFKQTTRNTASGVGYQQIYFSVEVMKHSQRLGEIGKKRVLVITNETVNLLRRNPHNSSLILRRKMHHRELRALTKSLSNYHDFIIHPTN